MVELNFNWKKKKTNNSILRLLLKKERKLKIKLQNQTIINNDLTYEIKNKTICPICTENDLSICCIPCGHTYCNNCIINTTNCHICRTEIMQTNKIYL
uniref:RING-type domain-containing protein n=1 Tax=viral metagenome TaxID=1070528 RepID=A0A6C0LID5_9ZZZZ